MPVDVPVLVLIAAVALVVASIVARRAGEHADRVAGRRPVAGSARRGPFGAVADLLDQSVAAYGLRRRLGLTTKTRSERQVAEGHAAQVAYADDIRRHRTGAPPPADPTHLVVSGHPGHVADAAPMHGSATLRQELVVAATGFVMVVLLVMAIAPRGSGAVLSATGVPAASADPRPTPTASPTPVGEPRAT